MVTGEALSADQITKVGVIVTIAIVVIGLLLSIVITALIGRIIILAIVVVLAILVWQQRAHVTNEINAHKCDLNATFFGVHLDPPDSVVQQCQQATS